MIRFFLARVSQFSKLGLDLLNRIRFARISAVATKQNQVGFYYFPLAAASWLRDGMGNETAVTKGFNPSHLLLESTDENRSQPVTLILLQNESKDVALELSQRAGENKTIEVIVPQPTFALRRTFNELGIARKEKITVMTRGIESRTNSSDQEFSVAKLMPSQIHSYVALNLEEFQHQDQNVELQLVQNRLNGNQTDVFQVSVSDPDHRETAIGNFAIHYLDRGADSIVKIASQLNAIREEQLDADSFSLEQLRSIAFIFDLLIHSDFRNRGIATETLNRIDEIARQNDSLALGVLATPANEPFYKLLGFDAVSSFERWS